MTTLLPLILLFAPNTAPLKPGNHTRGVKLEGTDRAYEVHVPKKYDARKPTPLVLALHGAGMNGRMMRWFSGLDATADREGFIVVYPNGTGTGELRTWNAGPLFRLAGNKADDVAYLGAVLDDLDKVLAVDHKRVFATGMSNGAMMSYRLAAELSERIAAIAPVAGTMLVSNPKPKRPVSVLHFHGTADALVPYEMRRGLGLMKGVDPSVMAWVNVNGCGATAKEEEVSAGAKDGLKVTRKTWTGGKEGSEVILYTIKDGGHTWPGRDVAFGLLGKSTKSISANEMIWEFFQKHPMK